jgi:hypothetical protein
MWIMPLGLSAVMFFFFPAGLVLYWLTNNILSIAQQWYINKRSWACWASEAAARWTHCTMCGASRQPALCAAFGVEWRPAAGRTCSHAGRPGDHKPAQEPRGRVPREPEPPSTRANTEDAPPARGVLLAGRPRFCRVSPSSRAAPAPATIRP